MAQDETKFSHITVTSDDEDDVVIHAGLRSTTPPAPAVATPEPEAAPVLEPAPEPPAPEARRKDDYRETTAEDLESEPMSLMQKALIAIAVVLVVAVAAYIATH